MNPNEYEIKPTHERLTIECGACEGFGYLCQRRIPECWVGMPAANGDASEAKERTFLCMRNHFCPMCRGTGIITEET